MAKLKKCKDCGNPISKSAKVCPKCGKKQKNGALKVLRISIGIIILIIGCSLFINDTSNNNVSTSIVTKENYDRIEKGMTEAEVNEILGEPTLTSESETSGVGTMILNHYQETFKAEAIEVYFLDGVVYMKNWVHL